jgi:two-component system CheB/CheR fusion protein
MEAPEMPDDGETDAHAITLLAPDLRGSLISHAPTTGGICIVGIGASAGGLDACRRLMSGIPANSGLAFILIQHLDPKQDSLLVELLAKVSAVPVAQATNGMIVEADHLYVIPPGKFLSFSSGALHLSEPPTRPGFRLPFDYLLKSLADAVGPRAICVILSGSGADGTIGLKAIKAAGGLVISQAPDDAAYAGMPRSAVSTGEVDFILTIDDIGKRLLTLPKLFGIIPPNASNDGIITLLKKTSRHDFTYYKAGTLERRISQRMRLSGYAESDVDGYIKMLENDPEERDRLADDLLINVTSFFRDPKVFETLASDIIPALLASTKDRTVRIWVAGCSTGEETYSLAMLFQEGLTVANSPAKLQIFASDVDAKAVAEARDGTYPFDIENSISVARLKRFFTKEETGYRVSPDIRANVVFAVQDVLADPPFSNLDFVSCRNLLIYLRPEAQERVIAIFNFSLRKDGILLLGSAETVGAADGRFAILSKPSRLYRKTATGPTNLEFSIPGGELVRAPQRAGMARSVAQGNDISDFHKRLVLEVHSPAAMLINPRFECLFSSGPTERYLRVVKGYPTQDLLAMLAPTLRARVKSAVSLADKEQCRIIEPGGRITHNNLATLFNIDVLPVMRSGEKLFLLSFVDQATSEPHLESAERALEGSTNVELEQQLLDARAEIETLSQNLEASHQEQHAINEEALSINEEYQSTNEELVTSKEELQSLNEELTAVNSQLHETLEGSRTTSNDLQNVLYSTDVATLFLDLKLNIRFFTPAASLLFTVIPGDVGRPLSDLKSLANDEELPSDALHVLKTHKSIERDIEGQHGTWFSRRVLPYRTHGDEVAGIVITFTDVTQRKKTKLALKAAQEIAEKANSAKSRFMAAASHDLRQPLQTLALLNGLLSKITGGAQAQLLLAKIDETTNSMSGILNTLLDINQIDAGVVKPDFESYHIGELLNKLCEEFAYVAEARGLSLRIVPCSLIAYTDPQIMEQILRNLISNALKYTKKGGVLVGCRRTQKHLKIEIWDSGPGIPETEFGAIFEEYHQISNAGRDRNRGLGLGLSIVQRLAVLLGTCVSVRSVLGKGSVFSVEIPISTVPLVLPAEDANEFDIDLPTVLPRVANILIVEDDPSIRHLLEMFLLEEGHVIAAAFDGDSAAKLVSSNLMTLDLIIVDYNLPGSQNGIEVIEHLRTLTTQVFSVIVCTGDIATETLKNIAKHDFVQMTKPMKLKDLNDTIQRLLIGRPEASGHMRMPVITTVPDARRVIYVVDDDALIRNTMRSIFEAADFQVETFEDCEKFVASARIDTNCCLLLDAHLPGISGLELLERLSATHSRIPAIMMTGQGDVKMAVQAIKAGAIDFIEKPVRKSDLLKFVERVFAQSRDVDAAAAYREKAVIQIASLTPRQRQVMDLVLAGVPSKNIAFDLGIAQRTVETHRASIMERTGAKSVPALARLAFIAT